MTDRSPVRISLRLLAMTALVAVPLACGGGGNSSGTGGSGGGATGGHAAGGAAGAAHTGGSGGSIGGSGGAGGSIGGPGGATTGGTAGTSAGGTAGSSAGGAGGRPDRGGASGSAGGMAGSSAGGGAGGVAGSAGHPAGGAAGGSAGGAAAGNAGSSGLAGAGGMGGVVALHTDNLLVNGDAEAAVGSTDGLPVTTPGWTVTFDATAMQYDQQSAGYPLSTDPGPADRGANLFIGGYKDALSTLSQTVDVSTDAAVIDANSVTITLSGYLGGYSSQEDNAVLSATFQDSGGQALGTALTIGPVTAADRNNVTGLLSRTNQAAVPSGTRSIAVVLTLTRTEGNANDGYADNLSVVLNTP